MLLSMIDVMQLFHTLVKRMDYLVHVCLFLALMHNQRCRDKPLKYQGYIQPVLTYDVAC
jgi:hypothetical protein